MISTTMKPALGAALLALLLAGGAHAQPLQDPTKPPPAATPVAGGPLAPAAAGPQLQSILIGRAAGGRHVAVIDGETVRQGESFRGAKVVRIGENEVELVRGGERQVLRLFAEAAVAGDHAATVIKRR